MKYTKKSLKIIATTLMFLFFLGVNSCDEFKYNKCDCVMLTENAMNHQSTNKSDHEWWKGLNEYCKKKGLNNKKDSKKWNATMKECIEQLNRNSKSK